MSGRIPVSREGYEEIKRQVAELQVKQLDASRAVGDAAEKGDLSENAEFDAAKEELGRVQGKLQEMKERLGRAQIVDSSKIDESLVQFGAKVTVVELDEDGDEGDEEVFQLVGQGEVNVALNKILSTSPMGQALLRKSVGDTAEFDAPGGALRFKVTGIDY